MFFSFSFSAKVLNFIQAQMLFFVVWFFNFYLSSLHFLCLKEGKLSTIEPQKGKTQEKGDRLLVSKMNFNFQISLRNKKPIDSVFSHWASFIEKVPMKNCFKNSKNLKDIVFF